MSLLPQLQTELVTAARRPPLARRVSHRLAAAILGAVAALLIAAPVSEAHRDTQPATPISQTA
jgi:hypothetical protein